MSLQILSILSLLDTYQPQLKRTGMSTLNEGSLRKLATFVLRPQGFRPDTSSSSLTSLLDVLSDQADAGKVNNLADLLLLPGAAQPFFSWIGGEGLQEAMSSGDDGLLNKLGMLSSLSKLDFQPTEDSEQRQAYSDLLKEVLPEASPALSELANVVYDHALDSNVSIRDYLTDRKNHKSLMKYAFAVFSAPGASDLRQGLSQINNNNNKESWPTSKLPSVKTEQSLILPTKGTLTPIL